MKVIQLLMVIFLCALNLQSLSAQTECPKFDNRFDNGSAFENCINIHRENYISAILYESSSPIKNSDTAYFDFYAADPTWWINATYILTPDSKEFQIATSSGNTKPYKQYALLFFERNETKFELAVYQSLSLIRNSEFYDYLFLPFMDLTNGEESYEGGRYIDLSKSDLKENHVQIDFNRAYNPYCAFSGGYSCPVPPKENRLKINVYAGEKKFRKPH